MPERSKLRAGNIGRTAPRASGAFIRMEEWTPVRLRLRSPPQDPEGRCGVSDDPRARDGAVMRAVMQMEAGAGSRASSGARVRADVGVAALMSLSYAIALFHRTAFSAIAPTLQAEFALSAAESADLAALFFWTALCVMIPLGLLADAVGARRVAIGGTLTSAIGTLLFRDADSVVMLALGRVLVAVGSTAAFIALMRYVSTTFPARKAAYSGRGIFVGNVGAVASGAPLALLLAVLAWRDVWEALAAASVALGLALAIASPAARRQGPRAAVARDPVRELRSLLASRHVHLGILMQAGLAGAFYAFGNVVAPRWLAARGFAPLESGWEISVLIGGYGVGAAFWGWIGDREHQRTRALLVAACGAMLGWLLIATLPVRSAFGVAALFALAGACCGAFGLVYPLIAERHPPSHAGGVIACVNCGIPLGAAVLQNLAGRVPEATAPWLLFAVGAVTVAGAAMLLAERHGAAPAR